LKKDVRMLNENEKIDYEDLRDEALLARARGGDAQAEEALYDRYKNVVRIRVRPYFLIGADRDDIIQEGMIGLYKAIRDYDAAHGSSFRVFAEMCVQRQIITAIKSATRLKHAPLNSYVSLYRPAYSDEDDRQLLDMFDSLSIESPEDAYIGKERYASLARGIKDMLTPLEKQVLGLFLEGRSYSDISSQLGRSVKSVDNALQRVKKKLEKYIVSQEA
jgi:RNA polymerase sporulation-specific sigma factor